MKYDTATDQAKRKFFIRFYSLILLFFAASVATYIIVSIGFFSSESNKDSKSKSGSLDKSTSEFVIQPLLDPAKYMDLFQIKSSLKSMYIDHQPLAQLKNALDPKDHHKQLELMSVYTKNMHVTQSRHQFEAWYWADQNSGIHMRKPIWIVMPGESLVFPTKKPQTMILQLFGTTVDKLETPVKITLLDEQSQNQTWTISPPLPAQKYDVDIQGKIVELQVPADSHSALMIFGFTTQEDLKNTKPRNWITTVGLERNAIADWHQSNGRIKIQTVYPTNSDPIQEQSSLFLSSQNPESLPQHFKQPSHLITVQDQFPCKSSHCQPPKWLTPISIDQDYDAVTIITRKKVIHPDLTKWIHRFSTENKDSFLHIDLTGVPAQLHPTWQSIAENWPQSWLTPLQFVAFQTFSKWMNSDFLSFERSIWQNQFVRQWMSTFPFATGDLNRIYNIPKHNPTKSVDIIKPRPGWIVVPTDQNNLKPGFIHASHFLWEDSPTIAVENHEVLIVKSDETTHFLSPLGWLGIHHKRQTYQTDIPIPLLPSAFARLPAVHTQSTGKHRLNISFPNLKSTDTARVEISSSLAFDDCKTEPSDRKFEFDSTPIAGQQTWVFQVSTGSSDGKLNISCAVQPTESSDMPLEFLVQRNDVSIPLGRMQIGSMKSDPKDPKFALTVLTIFPAMYPGLFWNFLQVNPTQDIDVHLYTERMEP